MATTQKEIALELGVSRTLVTMALQNNPRISFLTRERVKATAERLGYDEHSNREARVLINKRYGKRPRTRIIAMFMPRTMFDGTPVPTLPFFDDFIRGVEGKAFAHETDVFLCTLHNGRLPRLVSEGNVDGVISLGRSTAATRDLSVPVVSFGNTTDWSFGLVPDNEIGMEQAVEHLFGLGHRRIAYIGCDIQAAFGQFPHQFAVERLEGYKAALQRRGIKLDLLLVDTESVRPAMEPGFDAMTRLLSRTQNFTALVCFNDLMAMGAVKRLAESGRKVPHDVSVVGFDDVSRRYDFVPALTSIAFNREAMGQRATEIIIQAARDAEAGAPISLAGQRQRFETHVEIRDSCGAIIT